MTSLGAAYLRYTRFVFILGATLYSISNACQTCNSPWRFVYEHDDKGAPLSGNWDDLANAQERGARIRYVIPSLGAAGYVEELDNALTYDTVLCGESTLHLNKDRWDHFLDDGQWRFVVVCTDGRYEEYQYSLGVHTMTDETYSDARMLWFVQESTCPNSIYSHTDDGSALSGSKNALENAVTKGYDIKIHVVDGFTFPMHNIDIHDVTGIVSGQNVWNFYTTNTVGTEWWFQITSSNALMDEIFWNVGEHVTLDHSHYYEAVDWLIEPCWRLAYTNDANGREIAGSLADLVAAVERGQRVKVLMDSFSIELDNVRSDWGQVSGQLLSHVSKTVDKDKFEDDSSWVWQMVHTTGTVTTRRYSIGDVTNTGDSRARKTIKWFVDTREWRKALSTDTNGDVTFGSKAALKNAIENGASVRVAVQFGRRGTNGRLRRILGRRRQRGSFEWDGDSTAWFVMKAENVEFGDHGEIAAELIKSVSTKAVSSEFEITNDPFWRFMLVSTESNVDVAQWTVGAHTNNGHFAQKANVNWFVNY